MFTFGVRFSRVSMSGALLMLGCVPAQAFAASCDLPDCLTSSQANVVINAGTTLNVGTGGSIIDSTVNNGHLQIWDFGTSIGTTIDGEQAWLQLNDNGSAYDSVVNSGQMVVVGSATALRTTVNGGSLDVAQNALVSDTRLNGGAMWVYADATAKNTNVNNSQMTVYQNGTAEGTTVNGGGVMESLAGTHVLFTTVNQGGLMVLGDRAEASDTTINRGGYLDLKGDAILGFSTHVDGNVRFADPAINGFHTLLIKGPLSGNGVFEMNTDLATLRGDLLRVRGPVSGTHTLVVADSGNVPSGAQQQLMLVNGNGGSGSYSLYGQTVDAGAYRYELRQQGDDWYLANLAAVDPIDQPNGGHNPQPPITPSFLDPDNPAQRRPQAETLSKGANAAVASHAASAVLINAQMSATSGHFADLRSGKDKGGLWIRSYGTEQRLDTGASRAFQQQVDGMEIGADKALSILDGMLRVGGLVGQGQGRQDFGDASKGMIDSASFGGYASYLDHSGLYIDGTLKYSRLDNEINITSNLGNKVKAHYKNHAVSADVQVGKHIDLSQGWFVEPQAGLQMARISRGDYTASNGLSVEQDAMTSVQSRIGGVFGRDLELADGIAVKPYAKAAWITEHAGDSHVKVSGAKLYSRLPGARGEIGGGIGVMATDKHSFFVEGGYTKGSDIEQPWAMTVGYRYNW